MGLAAGEAVVAKGIEGEAAPRTRGPEQGRGKDRKPQPIAKEGLEFRVGDSEAGLFRGLTSYPCARKRVFGKAHEAVAISERNLLQQLAAGNLGSDPTPPVLTDPVSCSLLPPDSDVVGAEPGVRRDSIGPFHNPRE